MSTFHPWWATVPAEMILEPGGLNNLHFSSRSYARRLHASLASAYLTRAPLGYSTERAPLGGGADSAPSLTPERMVVKRRKNGKRKLSIRQILGTPTILLKEVRGQVRARSKVKTIQVSTLLASEPNWRSADRRYSPRTCPEVSKMSCRT